MRLQDVLELGKDALKRHLEAATSELSRVVRHELTSVREGGHLGVAAKKLLEGDIPQLVEAVEKGEFYQVVTEREKSEIVTAMGMGRGHWYRCPNGHVYTIGECGGAMQVSTCPECGEAIGGQSHELVSRNARDHAFERLVQV